MADEKKPRIPLAAEYQLPPDWKPTNQQPVPPQRCGATNQQGEQCRKWALQGTGLNGTKPVCLRHGGSIPQVKKAAEERVRIARLRIMDAAEGAFETIEYLSQFATQENVKLAAAKDILDRAGIKSGIDLNVTHEIAQSPALILAEKLAGMQKSIESEKEKEFTSSLDPDIIEVEVVLAEDPEEETETNE